MNENELLEELCVQVGLVEEDQFAGEEGVPVVVSIFAKLVLAKLRIWGCDNKQAVLDQANQFISDWVKNAMMAGMMKAALATAVNAICGE